MNDFTHFDKSGKAAMVDVGDKDETDRTATARGIVRVAPATLAMIKAGEMGKGDVLAVARLAGIQGAKKTADLIPLCHPLSLTGIAVDLECSQEQSAVLIAATCRLRGRTGVEMEALSAVSIAALTVYDMCKAVDKKMTIEQIRLTHKAGGRSGTFQSE